MLASLGISSDTDGRVLPVPDSISNAVTNELLLRYRMQNVPVPAAGTIKTGLYRQHVCSPASAVVGDFDFRRTG